MSYKQKLTYRGMESLSNKAGIRLRHSSTSDKNLDNTDTGGDTSPVGAVKDTFGYIGFTSQES